MSKLPLPFVLMKKVKPVLGIVSTWFERGATRVSLAYIQALQEDFTIRLYARAGDEFPHRDPEWNKAYVHWGEFVPGAPTTYIDTSDFHTWCERESIDILLFNEQQNWDIILHLHQRDKRPLIGAYIDYYTDQTAPFFGLYDFLLCNTRRHFSVFENHPGALYVPWGVDLGLFARAEIQPPKKKHFTFFHSLGYNPNRKGSDLLISAFRSMPEEDIRLILHAQRPLSDFPSLVDAVSDDSRITWIDQEVAPPGLYHLGDVYVYPSRLDGIGLSLPEALASGLPAIVTDEAPMNEFVQEGVNGWLVPVSAYRKRADGYYWELSEVAASDLARVMRSVYLESSHLEKWRDQCLQHANHTFDWKRNTLHLAQKLLVMQQQVTDQALFASCRAYVDTTTPTPSIKDKLHRILIRCGARRVKRLIFGRS